MNQLLKKKNELTKKKKGFTLVELIIVIAVIAILAAMAIPKFSAIRKDAKISNDIAAAKNITTITATLISNGTISAPTGSTVTTIDVSSSSDTIATEIRGKLDGKYNEGKSQAKGTAFTVEIDSNEGIKVLCGSEEVYPNTAATFK